jgi:hypothetical protein
MVDRNARRDAVSGSSTFPIGGWKFVAERLCDGSRAASAHGKETPARLGVAERRLTAPIPPRSALLPAGDSSVAPDISPTINVEEPSKFKLKPTYTFRRSARFPFGLEGHASRAGPAERGSSTRPWVGRWNCIRHAAEAGVLKRSNQSPRAGTRLHEPQHIPLPTGDGRQLGPWICVCSCCGSRTRAPKAMADSPRAGGAGGQGRRAR